MMTVNKMKTIMVMTILTLLIEDKDDVDEPELLFL